jgi:glycosyltransferase involved in cell wall biosynthesis
MENLNYLKPIELDKLIENPLTSVLMVNYNYARFIEEAIESVIDQSYKNWELIICDDGSTDESVEIVESICKTEERIKLIKKENGGVASALNMGYSKCKGEIICLLDSDDVFHKDKIEEVIQILHTNMSSGFCIHKVLPINWLGKPINKPIPINITEGWVAKKALLTGGRTPMPPASGLAFRRKVLESIFPLSLEFNIYADGIIAELSQYITIISSIKKPLSGFRLHSSNTTSVFLDYPNKASILKGQTKHALFIQTHKTFIKKNLGPEFVTFFDFTKRENFWDEKLALFILDSKPKNGIEGHSGKEMCLLISNKYRGAIWRLLIILPGRIAKKILKLWWSPSAVKKYLTFISRYTNY